MLHKSTRTRSAPLFHTQAHKNCMGLLQACLFCHTNVQTYMKMPSQHIYPPFFFKIIHFKWLFGFPVSFLPSSSTQRRSLVVTLYSKSGQSLSSLEITIMLHMRKSTTRVCSGKRKWGSQTHKHTPQNGFLAYPTASLIREQESSKTKIRKFRSKRK